jgi:tripartite-type tricarboxylate transporter receptor subunit TctC
MAEAGVPGYEATTWYALLAPAGLRNGVATRLNTEIGRILADPVVVEKLNRQGIEPITMGQPELAAYITSEIDKWSAVVRAANIKVE